MGKMDELVMVIKRDILFGNNDERLSFFKYGFCSGEDFDFAQYFQSKRFERRGNVENNSEYKQPIAYGMIINPATKMIFAYQRSDDKKRYHEDRLAGNWSWGFGGHIHPEDAKLGDPIIVSLKRELEEETTGNNFKLEKIGYVNYDGDDVGKVHLGVLFVAHYNGYLQVRDEAKHGEWLSYEELCKIAKNPKVDEWSRIALIPLERILSAQHLS